MNSTRGRGEPDRQDEWQNASFQMVICQLANVVGATGWREESPLIDSLFHSAGLESRVLHHQHRSPLSSFE